MASPVGSLVAVLRANVRPFVDGLKKAGKRTKTFNKKVQKTTGSMNALSASMKRVIAVGALVLAAKKAIDFADSIDKVSKKLGVASEELQILRFAADKAGIKMATFDMGLQRIVRRVAEAAVGTGEAQGAIKELGLDAKKLSELPVGKMLEAVAISMGKVESEGQRVRLMMKLADSEGVGLVTLMPALAAGLDDIAVAAKAAGVVLSQESIDAMVRAKEAITKLKLQLTVITATLVSKVAPVLTTIVDGVGKLNRDLGSLVKLMGRLAVAIGLVVLATKAWTIALKAWSKAKAIATSLTVIGAGRIAAATAIAVAAVVGIEKAFSAIEDGAKEAESALVPVENLVAAINSIEAGAGLDDLGQDIAATKSEIQGLIEKIAELQAGGGGPPVAATIIGKREEIVALTRELTALHLEMAEGLDSKIAEEHHKKLADAISAANAKLYEQTQTFGDAADEVERWRFVQAGATEAELAHFDALRLKLRGLQDLEKQTKKLADEEKKRADALQAAADRVKDSIRTPLEEFKGTMDELRELFAKKLLNPEEFKKAAAAALKALEDSKLTNVLGTGLGTARADTLTSRLAQIAGPGAAGKQPADKEGQDTIEVLLGKIEGILADPQPVLIKFSDSGGGG